MGDIAKGKASGYSGNTPDLYASLPVYWHEWALKLANLTQHTGVTPTGTSTWSAIYTREVTTGLSRTTDRCASSRFCVR